MKKILIIMCLIALSGCSSEYAKEAKLYRDCNFACSLYNYKTGEYTMIEGCFEKCINQPQED